MDHLGGAGDGDGSGLVTTDELAGSVVEDGAELLTVV